MNRASLLATGFAMIAVLCPASDLEVGGSLEGALEQSDQRSEERGLHDTVTLALSGGVPVVIDLVSDDFDTYLMLALPNGSTMEDDDGGGGRNSRLIIPPAEGEAVVTVMSFNGTGTGDYTLSTEEVAVERASVGVPFAGEVTGSATTVMLEVTEGETLLIDLESAEFDTTLTLTDPSGNEMYDDDGGQGYNSRLIVTPDESGDSTLLIAGFGGGSGTFTLFARPLESDGVLTVGETLAEIFDGGDDSSIFELRGEPGVRLRVDLSSEDFDTVLTAVSETGQLRTCDDVGASTDSRLMVLLPESGVTHLLVSSYDGRGGSFTLQADVPPPAMLPAFTLHDPEGEMISSSAFDGQVRMINLWGTWCGPCIMELPDINAIAQELADRGLVVIGIAVDNTPREVREFLRENPLDFTTLIDDGRVSEVLGSLTDLGALEGVPTTFFVDRRGEVRAVLSGPQTREEFLAALEPLLDPLD